MFILADSQGIAVGHHDRVGQATALPRFDVLAASGECQPDGNEQQW